ARRLRRRGEGRAGGRAPGRRRGRRGHLQGEHHDRRARRPRGAGGAGGLHRRGRSVPRRLPHRGARQRESAGLRLWQLADRGGRGAHTGRLHRSPLLHERNQNHRGRPQIPGHIYRRLRQCRGGRGGAAALGNGRFPCRGRRLRVAGPSVLRGRVGSRRDPGPPPERRGGAGRTCREDHRGAPRTPEKSAPDQHRSPQAQAPRLRGGPGLLSDAGHRPRRAPLGGRGVCGGWVSSRRLPIL
ncbi:MAG: hypothetical protein AVDCRST_MAG12-2615, partial [uncultured Rubrobacteraceae bacterium]